MIEVAMGIGCVVAGSWIIQREFKALKKRPAIHEEPEAALLANLEVRAPAYRLRWPKPSSAPFREPSLFDGLEDFMEPESHPESTQSSLGLSAEERSRTAGDNPLGL